MKRVRFVMVGGFLGAGKTTAIGRLARHYVDQGLNVGIVTNDQAYNLVDTEALKAQGFQVGEVPGACFCCKFNDLVETAEGLQKEQVPDVIIAEPVGSCTDLVATVIEPLRHLYGDQYEIGPLAVLLKPEHGQKILRNQSLGFSPKAAYIFLKQIEEADVVVLNKIDKLSIDERQELVELVGQRFPGKQVLATSARTGDEFEALIEAVSQTAAPHKTLMDVDYDVYAEGEAELGWLNCQARLVAADQQKFSLDQLLLDLVNFMHRELANVNGEAAHLKVMGQSGNEPAIVNLVGGGAEVELSLESGVHTDQAELIVNARVATSPEELEELVRRSVDATATQYGLTSEVTGVQRFRPGRPVPTHRVSSTG